MTYPLNYSTSNNVPDYDVTEVKQALIDIRDQHKSSYTSRVLISLSFLHHDEHINVQRDIDSMEKALKDGYSFDCYRIDIHQNDEQGGRLLKDVCGIIMKYYPYNTVLFWIYYTGHGYDSVFSGLVLSGKRDTRNNFVNFDKFSDMITRLLETGNVIFQLDCCGAGSAVRAPNTAARIECLFTSATGKLTSPLSGTFTMALSTALIEKAKHGQSFTIGQLAFELRRPQYRISQDFQHWQTHPSSIILTPTSIPQYPRPEESIRMTFMVRITQEMSDPEFADLIKWMELGRTMFEFRILNNFTSSSSLIYAESTPCFHSLFSERIQNLPTGIIQTKGKGPSEVLR